MKTRRNRRNRRNTKKFRGGSGQQQPWRRKRPAKPEEGLEMQKLDESPVPTLHANPNDCTEESKVAMKRAQAVRKKGSSTRYSSVQQQMKLIENKLGPYNASEFKCAFHPNNGWVMPKGKVSGFISNSCPECDKCITGGSEHSSPDPPNVEEDPPNVEEETSGTSDNRPGSEETSTSPNKCSESAALALKVFASLQSGNKEEAARIRKCIEDDSGGTAASDPQNGNIGNEYDGSASPAEASTVANPNGTKAMAIGGKRKKSKSKRNKRSKKTMRRKLKKRSSRKK